MTTQAEVAKKREYVVQLLTTNKAMSPVDVAEKVTKKFGSGIAKPDIANIRLTKFGIKLGPGGSVITVKAEKNGRSSPAAHTPEGDEDHSKLARIVAELKAEMKAQRIGTLTVSADGPVEAKQLVERVIQLS